jgi:hypothetical protein
MAMVEDGRDSMKARIHCTSKDIELVWDGGQRVQIPWDEVSQVYTYKDDAIAHYVTYTIVQLTYGEDITLFEDMEGWEEFLSVLGNRAGMPIDALRRKIAEQTVGGDVIVLYEQDV